MAGEGKFFKKMDPAVRHRTEESEYSDIFFSEGPEQIQEGKMALIFCPTNLYLIPIPFYPKPDMAIT